VVQAALIAGLVLSLGRRRKAERSLRESEERMKLAASAAELGMWEWDFTNNNVRVEGRGSERISSGNSNYSRFLKEVHPEDRDGVAQAVAKALVGDGSFEHIHRHMLPDGRVRWIAARARVEFDAEHRPKKMRGVAFDITTRKVAEDRARESEREFLLIANSAAVMIWTSGLDKLCTFVNQRWLEFTGRTLEEELGDGWAEGLHPDDRANSLAIYMQAFDARQPFTMEFRSRRYDGRYRWISDHGVPRYDANQNFLGYIGSCVDVTERKETEEAVQLWQRELEQVSRFSMLGELAGSLAHELNQPLAAIVSSAEAAQRFMEPGRRDDQEVREALADIAQQGQRAGEIIAGMRAMLRNDRGQMVAQDMNLVVREVFEMVRSDLLIKRVTPVMRLDPLLPLVLGRGIQLRQVLLNLVINACDAMSEMPAELRQLTIESRRVTTHEVEVSVMDAGPGFPEEILRHAFEPFRTTKSKGLGLGLAICRSIIAMHGGRLVVVNNDSKGAMVRLTLPARNGTGE
jgi:PAS domain S-box-containing protein